MNLTYQSIVEAAPRIAPYVKKTPFLPSSMLGDMFNIRLGLKLEHLQYTGSFKLRGACNKILTLSDREREQGVIACSAGNHAQGVAYIAGRLGIKSVIIMPQTTPYTKISRTENLGAHVILHGQNFDEAAKYADQLAKEDNMIFIHPYDDPHVIAGQGTIGLEMADHIKDMDYLLIPVGGGGLASGIAIAAHQINPALKIIGIQTQSVPAFHHHFKKIKTKFIPSPTIAEGIAVKNPGAKTCPILDQHLHDVVLVSEESLEHAVWLLNVKEKIIAEGAGAAAIAAITEHQAIFNNNPSVGAIICGGNIDSFLQSSILMRSLVKQGNIFELIIGVQDRPGILAQISKIIGEKGANILEVNHQRLNKNMPLMMAEIHISIEVKDKPHLDNVKAALAENGFSVKTAPY